MLIKIVNRFTANGSSFYEWSLNDGPDGIEEVHGYATDLITAFSKLLEWHERINADYAAELQEDINNAKNFVTNNETDC
jgi:hypothetical protein